MGSVDKQDQMLQCFCIARKTVKWYKKLVFHLFHVVLTKSYILLMNSYILYQKNGGPSTFLTFQHDVAANFLFTDSETPDKAERSESLRQISERLFPDTLQPTSMWSKP